MRIYKYTFPLEVFLVLSNPPFSCSTSPLCFSYKLNLSICRGNPFQKNYSIEINIFIQPIKEIHSGMEKHNPKNIPFIGLPSIVSISSCSINLIHPFFMISIYSSDLIIRLVKFLSLNVFLCRCPQQRMYFPINSSSV